MSNYENLKNSIKSVIKDNNNQEITGSRLQEVLLSVVTTIGDNRTFAGVVSPTSEASNLDANVFYFAYEEGVYTSFGDLVLPENTLAIIYNQEKGWSMATINIIQNLADSVGDSSVSAISQAAVTSALNTQEQNFNEKLSNFKWQQI